MTDDVFRIIGKNLVDVDVESEGLVAKQAEFYITEEGMTSYQP